MKKIRTTEIDTEEIYCDFCEDPKKVNYNYTGHQGCEICGRDGCNDHLVNIYYPEMGISGGDVKYTFCISCNNIMEPFIEEMGKRQETHQLAIESLYELGRQNSLEQYEKNKK